jgi:uncharacterized protein
MVLPLSHWKELYQKFKHEAICIDVEATYWDGPISVIGIYRPKEGEIEYHSFIRGVNLTPGNLKKMLTGCKLLITFNGTNYDVPEIEKQFPGVLPKNVPAIDLYLLARRLELDTNLKVLERTLGISRLESVENKRKISTKMWNRYEKKKDQKALNMLIEYNRQDTINLYPLAEKIMELIK